MSSRRRDGEPAQHPRLARFPLRDRLADLTRAAGRGRQRRQGAGPRRGVAGCRPGSRTTIWPWWSRPASAAASCSTAGCSTVTDGNAGHIGHVVVEPDGRPCVCGGRGCLEAEASGTAIAADHRAARRRGRPDRCAVAPAPWSGGRWPRWPTSSTSSWPWWPARWPSASATSFFDAAQDEIGAPVAASTSPGPTRIDPGRPRCRRAPGRCGGRRSPRHSACGGPGTAVTPGHPATATADVPPGAGAAAAGSRAVVGRRCVRRPDLWWTALGALRRLAAPGLVADAAPPARARPATVGVPDGHRLRTARRRPGPGRRDLLPGVVPGHRRHRGGRGRPGPATAVGSPRPSRSG